MAADRTHKALDQDHLGDRGGDAGVGALGRRLGDLVRGAARVWNKIIRRDVGCVILAMLFSAVFVVPPILIFGDRRLPFEYGHTYAKNERLRAGETGTNVFTVKDVRKNCEGEFSRFFTDSVGNRFFLGTFRTNYQHGLAASGNRSFEKDWTVPLGAQPGPGLYETEPRFWCNWVQGAFPISAEPVKIKIIVLPGH